jgi:flagellar protein FliO/FliZ
VSGLGFQSFFAVLVVLALVGAMAWLVRRGAFGALRHGTRAIAVETAVPIGERRSLIIVAVEGRRLLLGLTPGQISMVTELGPVAAQPVSPGDGSGGGSSSSFEQQLIARAKGAFGFRTRQELRTTDVRAGSTPEPLTTTNRRFGNILQLSAQES